LPAQSCSGGGLGGGRGAPSERNQQHDVNEHYVLEHFFAQSALYAAIVSSRPV